MDPGNGRLYTDNEVTALRKTDRALVERLVRIEGREEDVRSIAAHVERGTRGDRRRSARKASKLARRKNR